MKLQQVKEILDATLYGEEGLLDEEVEAACGCDLMSDVLAFASERNLLLTGLINLQVIRTAEMLDMKGIIFVRGKKPTEEMMNLARNKQICLLSTNMPLYVACGKLYMMGLGGKGDY